MRAKNRPICLSLPNIIGLNQPIGNNRIICDMRRTARTMALCICTAASFLGSCIQMTDELDLNKEISLDMQIGPGGLSIPIGSLSKIYLDSLIKIDGDESILDTIGNGLFGITMDGSIDKVDVSIGDVTINIPKPDIKEITASFDETDIDDIEIDTTTQKTKITIQSIDLSTINNSLPELKTVYSTKTDNMVEVDIPSSLLGFDTPDGLIPPIVVDEQEEQCNFSYTLPSDVSCLNTIYLGNPDGDVEGQIITLNVDLSSIFSVSNQPNIRVNYLEVKFPSEFTVAKYPGLDQYIDPAYVSVSDGVFSISNALLKSENVGSNHILPVSFIITEADFSDYGQSIDFNKSFKYKLSLDISFKCTETGHKQFYIDVAMNEKLKMRDFSVNTNEKELSLPSGNVASSYEITGLDNLSRVNYIDFDESQSVLNLSFSDFNINPFEFDESSAIRLQFPVGFEFVKSNDGKLYVENTAVGEWEGNSNTLDIWPGLAKGKIMDIYVRKLSILKDVDDVQKSIEVDNNVSYSGSIKIMAKNNIGKDALDVLTDKDITFKVWGKLAVSNANVETASIDTEINEETVISIDEEIDQALASLNCIDLTNPAGAAVQLKFGGVPQTFTTLKFTALTVEFPEFLLINYYGNDPRIKVEGSKLVVDGNLSRYELDDDGDGFNIEGLKIEGMSFDPALIIEDGHIKLEDTVRISGKVTVPNQVLNSEDMKDIKVTPNVSFDPVVVKSVTGKVNPKIDDIHEVVDLSLGDDIDFLKDSTNNITLSDPRIRINITSSVTVPIDLDLKLSTLDAQGNVLVDNIVPDEGTIRIAKCDPDVDSITTTIIIYKTNRPEADSENTVFVPMSSLSNLLNPVPDKVVFDLKASINQGETHYVDLTRELAVSGGYEVEIPLSFDSLYIEYSDTIDDLGKNFEDFGDKLDATTIDLEADVLSTIPFGVNLSVYALDKNNHRLDDITFESRLIKPGNDEGVSSDLLLAVKVKKGALARLESIVFTAALESAKDSKASIKKGQYLDISNVRLNLPEGLIVDFTESKDKK